MRMYSSEVFVNKFLFSLTFKTTIHTLTNLPPLLDQKNIKNKQPREHRPQKTRRGSQWKILRRARRSHNAFVLTILSGGAGWCQSAAVAVARAARGGGQIGIL